MMDYVKEKIEECGVAIVAMQSKGHAGAAYTVGMTGKGVPELYVMLPPDSPDIVTRMLNDMNGIALSAMETPESVRKGVHWSSAESSYTIELLHPENPKSLTEVARFYPLGYQVLEMSYQPK